MHPLQNLFREQETEIRKRKTRVSPVNYELETPWITPERYHELASNLEAMPESAIEEFALH